LVPPLADWDVSAADKDTTGYRMASPRPRSTAGRKLGVGWIPTCAPRADRA